MRTVQNVIRTRVVCTGTAGSHGSVIVSPAGVECCAIKVGLHITFDVVVKRTKAGSK